MWAWDTDGSAMGFSLDGSAMGFSVDAIPASCQTDPAQPVLDALLNVEQWSVKDDNHIVLHGDHEISLTRQP